MIRRQKSSLITLPFCSNSRGREATHILSCPLDRDSFHSWPKKLFYRPENGKGKQKSLFINGPFITPTNSGTPPSREFFRPQSRKRNEIRQITLFAVISHSETRREEARIHSPLFANLNLEWGRMRLVRRRLLSPFSSRRMIGDPSNPCSNGTNCFWRLVGIDSLFDPIGRSEKNKWFVCASVIEEGWSFLLASHFTDLTTRWRVRQNFLVKLQARQISLIGRNMEGYGRADVNRAGLRDNKLSFQD